MAEVNPGTTNLTAWWSFDATTGNAIDSHSVYDITESSGTIEAATGLVSGARKTIESQTEYFATSNNEFDYADGDISFGGWYKLGAVNTTTTIHALIAKYYSTANYRSFMLAQNSSQFRLLLSGDGETYTELYTEIPSLAAETWYFVVGWLDSVGEKIGIRWNATNRDTAHSAGLDSNSATMFFGAWGVGGYGYSDLTFDENFFYRGLLSSDNLDWLYNSGNGRSYASLTPSDAPVATINGVQWSSLATVNGIATASVSSIQGFG